MKVLEQNIDYIFFNVQNEIMEGLDTPKNYFSAHVKILRIFGLWSFHRDDKLRSPKPFSEVLYSLYQITFLFTFAYLFTISEIIQLFISWTNFDDFINNLCYTIVHVMACSKITLILFRAKDIKNLTRSFETGIFKIRGHRTTEEKKLVNDCVLRTKKLLNVYFLIGTSVVTNGLLVPLYISTDSKRDQENLFENSDDRNYTVFVTQRRLPYRSYFPFDVNVSPNHELAYIYQGFCLMTLSPIIVTTDVLYGSILLHIATQLRVLARTLVSLKTIAEKKLAKSKSKNRPKVVESGLLETEIYKLLKHCVLHHHAIIGLTFKMEKIFSILVLLQFLCNLVIMCFPLFQITSVPIMSFPFFSMVSLMTAMMYQLFIFCDCGDEVTWQSLLVADAAYSSNWYDSTSSVRLKKAISLIISRSRRPLKLTVAKFAMLSRETYLRVVQGSASYFMFLRRIRDDR